MLARAMFITVCFMYLRLDYPPTKDDVPFPGICSCSYMLTQLVYLFFWGGGLDNLFLAVDFVKNGLCSKNRRERWEQRTAVLVKLGRAVGS
jgi:hypothetical protein